MLSLHRNVFFLSIAVGFSLFVIYFTLQPLASEGFRSYIGKHQYADQLFGHILPPNATSPSSQPVTPSATSGTRPPATTIATPPAAEKVLIVASTRAEDTSWIERSFPDWKTAIYTADDPNASLHTSRNKGHEASVYLTFIINNYANLPTNMVFIHSHQKHKHGTRDKQFEGIDYDNLETINALNLSFVQKNGYASLRCLALPGCPAEIQPFRPEEQRDPLRPQEAAMPEAWKELFENSDVPHVLAAPCCAQFAVSRDQVLKRKKEEYERFLSWLYDTPLDDFTSGRIFEYLWHVIFGREAVYCPDEDQCYKDQFDTTASAVHKIYSNTTRH